MGYVDKEVLKREVRIALDENMASDALLAEIDIDTLKLNEIIESKLGDAALAVVMAAPAEKLGDVSKPLTGTIDISDGDRHIVTMQLPSNFVRMVRFKMDSWPRPVYLALPPATPLYDQAHSGFNVFGTKERPAVFLVPKAGGMYLEAFCAGSTRDSLDGCLYAERPKEEEYTDDSNNTHTGYFIGEHLLRPTIYYAAYLTALDVKDADAATALLATAKELLGIQ